MGSGVEIGSGWVANRPSEKAYKISGRSGKNIILLLICSLITKIILKYLLI